MRLVSSFMVASIQVYICSSLAGVLPVSTDGATKCRLADVEWN